MSDRAGVKIDGTPKAVYIMRRGSNLSYCGRILRIPTAAEERLPICWACNEQAGRGGERGD